MSAVKADLRECQGVYILPHSLERRKYIQRWEWQSRRRLFHSSHSHLKDWFPLTVLQEITFSLCKLILQSFKSLIGFAALAVGHFCTSLFWEVWSMTVRCFRESYRVANCWEPLGADVEPQAQNLTFFTIWNLLIKKSAFVKWLFFPYLFSGLLLWKIFLKGSTIQTVHHSICLFSKAGWICLIWLKSLLT